MDNLVHHGIRHNVETKKEVILVVAEKASSKSLYFINSLPFVCTIQIFCLTLQRNPPESLSLRQTSGLSFSYRQMQRHTLFRLTCPIFYDIYAAMPRSSR